MSSPALRPCPLCEGAGRVEPGGCRGFVYCADTQCGMSNGHMSLADWNALPRRSDAAPLVEVVEALLGMDPHPNHWGKEQNALTEEFARAAFATYKEKTNE